MARATLPRLARGGAALLALAALTAACGGGTHPSAAVSSGPSAGVQTVSIPRLGSVLADAQGRTLYVLLSATGRTLPCTGPCRTPWPPELESAGVPAAGAGVTASLSVAAGQLDINGRPVYRFFRDSAPGQANGQGIHTFGGTWSALDPTGQPLTLVSAASSPATSPSSSSGGYQY